MMFRDQVGVLAGWFKGWNECEQTVALLSLLKRVSRTQARFLQLCLEHSLADCTELHILEGEANNPGIINQWQQESKDKVISLLLTHLPLLKPGNIEAKVEYMKLLPKILAHSIEHNQHIEESRQLLSYALIHPATSLEDRSALAMWLNHLEDRTSSSSSSSSSGGFGGQGRGRSDSLDYGQAHYYHQRQNSDDKLNNGWQNSRDSGISVSASSWQDKNLACENGHLPLYSSSSVPTTINTIGTSTSTILSGQTHHSPLKRSVSLTPPMNVPNQPLGHGWMSHEDLRARGPQCIPSDHAPLSPQSSVASSGSGGSEHLEDQPSARNTFQEEGSGMKDVPAWLKSLRLHKYAALFSQMTYEEMMALTECQLEAQNVTKGARHKIVISIQKLKERQNLLKSLEGDILEGGNLRVPLQELHQMILTPIKAYSSQSSSTEEHGREVDSHHGHPPSLLGSGRDGQGSDCKDSAAAGMQQHHLPGCEGESGGAPLPEGDLPGQFTRVMGKVCTQLLVSRPDEENISSYLQLIDKCLIHEAFTEIQKKRLLSWKQQVQKLFRSFPRKSLLELSGYRQQRSRGFGQSNSLPSAGSTGAGLARRNPRQFQIPSRNLPTARLGLLGPSGLLGTPQRSPAASPAILKQGRQNLWFANPGGSNSMPSRSHSSVQRTRSLPVHTSPQTMLMFQQPEFQVPVTEPDINNRLESLCLSMTEHALSDGVDRTSTI
ncbi:protein Smaug homolog 1 isoform X2 [Ammospiza caudacuta]|uniref:protein Smaug homolog 1 isoform X2 n=1 Tax=Ammospiza caudacuta TaxID=2857398 RepID=UPI002739DFF7|nr:protein Smaug homolog 1 isoform X2 [Ammospiza caudacuta]